MTKDLFKQYRFLVSKEERIEERKKLQALIVQLKRPTLP